MSRDHLNRRLLALDRIARLLGVSVSIADGLLKDVGAERLERIRDLIEQAVKKALP